MHRLPVDGQEMLGNPASVFGPFEVGALPGLLVHLSVADAERGDGDRRLDLLVGEAGAFLGRVIAAVGNRTACLSTALAELLIDRTLEAFDDTPDVRFAAPWLHHDAQVLQAPIVLERLVPSRPVRNDPLRPAEDIRGLDAEFLEVGSFWPNGVLNAQADGLPVGRARPQPKAQDHVGQHIDQHDDPEPPQEVARIVDGKDVDLRLVDLADLKRMIGHQRAATPPMFPHSSPIAAAARNLFGGPMLPKAALHRVERDRLEPSLLQPAVDHDHRLVQGTPFGGEVLLVEDRFDDALGLRWQPRAAAGIVPQQVADQAALAVLAEVAADRLRRPLQPGGQIVDGGGTRLAVRRKAIKDTVELCGEARGLGPAWVARWVVGSLPHTLPALPRKRSAARKF